MRILLLGSKPNAVIPKDVDLITYINGSINLNCQENKTFYHVFGDSIFHWQSEIALKNKSFLIDQKPYLSYVILHQNVDIKTKIKEVNYDPQDLIQITRKEKSDIERKFMGHSFILPVIINKHVNVKTKINTIRWFFRTGERKVSTGVFALLLLLRDFPEADIVISGIGFGPDEYSWYKSNKVSKRGHFVNDFIAFKRLMCRGYLSKVTTTEEDLNKLFGIPFIA